MMRGSTRKQPVNVRFSEVDFNGSRTLLPKGVKLPDILIDIMDLFGYVFQFDISVKMNASSECESLRTNATGTSS